MVKFILLKFNIIIIYYMYLYNIFKTKQNLKKSILFIIIFNIIKKVIEHLFQLKIIIFVLFILYQQLSNIYLLGMKQQ